MLDLTFISLGLSDSLLGSAWTVMQVDLSAKLGLAGAISMVICAGTVISSLFCNRLVSKFGTGKVTFVSVAMTATALYGFSLSPSSFFLFLSAIPLGLGAGSVDAALNNFISLHYKAKHMSWLHCFWGIGATAGPAIMSIFILYQGGWKKGYLTIAIIQTLLVVSLFIALPIWKKAEKSKNESETTQHKPISNRDAIKIPFVKLALIAFVFTCATELTTGLWSSSFLVSVKGISPSIAARWVSYFYGGITIGRFVSGFLTMKIKNNQLIRIGQITCLVGTVLIVIPLPAYASMIGLIIIGLGISPVFLV